jgi:hypothetical protein
VKGVGDLAEPEAGEREPDDHGGDCRHDENRALEVARPRQMVATAADPDELKPEGAEQQRGDDDELVTNERGD